MEKYRANRNNDMTDVPEKSEHEKKQESTEKAVDLAATVALDAYTGGSFSKVKNVASNVPVVGETVNNVWNGAVGEVSKVVSKTPVGDVAKKLDDSGITDTAKNVYDVMGGSMNGGGAGKAASAANSASNASKATDVASKASSKSQKSLSSNSSSISSSSSNSSSISSSSSNSFLSGNSFLSDNVMNFKLSPLLKLKLIGIGAGVILFFMIFMVIIGQKDMQNNAVTNLTVFSDSSIGSRSCTVEEIKSKIVYVGGKRVNDVKNSVNSSTTYLINDLGGYYNFKNNILASLDSKLSSMDKGIVILDFDIFDLTNFDSYVNDYSDIIIRYPNINFYVLSLSPVDESQSINYGIDNSMILNYNYEIFDNFDNYYVDTYSYLASGFNTLDGISYDNDTNIKLYDYLMSTISSNPNILCSDGSIENINSTQYMGGGIIPLNSGETIVSKIGQSEIDMLNNSIRNDVNSAGKGSGLAVTIAAYDLIQGLMNKGVIVPYQLGGQSNYNGIDGSWSLSNGLDSYGFLMWSMVNGGCSFNYKNNSELIALGTEIEPFSSVNGDLVVNDDSVKLILKNDGMSLIVAESNKNYGVVFNSYYYSEIDKVISLADYYKNGC